MNIVFSSDVIQALPLYMGYKSRTQFFERYKCRYTKGYLSRIIAGDKTVSPEVNAEMNRIWQECNLSFTDLEKIYQFQSNKEQPKLKKSNNNK